jgi:hypothetical protein
VLDDVERFGRVLGKREFECRTLQRGKNLVNLASFVNA